MSTPPITLSDGTPVTEPALNPHPLSDSTVLGLLIGFSVLIFFIIVITLWLLFFYRDEGAKWWKFKRRGNEEPTHIVDLEMGCIKPTIREPKNLRIDKTPIRYISSPVGPIRDEPLLGRPTGETGDLAESIAESIGDGSLPEIENEPRPRERVIQVGECEGEELSEARVVRMVSTNRQRVVRVKVRPHGPVVL